MSDELRVRIKTTALRSGPNPWRDRGLSKRRIAYVYRDNGGTPDSYEFHTGSWQLSSGLWTCVVLDPHGGALWYRSQVSAPQRGPVECELVAAEARARSERKAVA